jgi:hypothetical protein
MHLERRRSTSPFADHRTGHQTRMWWLVTSVMCLSAGLTLLLLDSRSHPRPGSREAPVADEPAPDLFEPEHGHPTDGPARFVPLRRND